MRIVACWRHHPMSYIHPLLRLGHPRPRRSVSCPYGLPSYLICTVRARHAAALVSGLTHLLRPTGPSQTPIVTPMPTAAPWDSTTLRRALASRGSGCRPLPRGKYRVPQREASRVCRWRINTCHLPLAWGFPPALRQYSNHSREPSARRIRPLSRSPPCGSNLPDQRTRRHRRRSRCIRCM